MQSVIDMLKRERDNLTADHANVSAILRGCPNCGFVNDLSGNSTKENAIINSINELSSAIKKLESEEK